MCLFESRLRNKAGKEKLMSNLKKGPIFVIEFASNSVNAALDL